MPLSKHDDFRGASSLAWAYCWSYQGGCTLFTHMEMKVNTMVDATQADDTEVDLAIFSPLEETPEQTKAQVVSRRFIAQWWAHKLSRKAWQWWHNHGGDPVDTVT